MKSGALLSVLGAIGCAGYFGYDYWHDRKIEKARAAEQDAAKRQREAEKRGREAGSNGGDVALPGPDPTGPSAGGSNGSEAEAPHGPWTIAVPDLTGKTVEQAKALLTKTGFDVTKFEVLENSSCHYDDDKDMLPVGVICSQAPMLPADIPPHSPITVAVEHDTYEAGQIGSPMEWRRMPSLIGLTESEAKSLLSTKGFAADAFDVEYKEGCGRRGTVCQTHPDPEARVVKARKGQIQVSR